MNSVRRMTATNEIGRWIQDNMRRHDMTCAEVAQILHCNKQSVSNHITGKVLPSYVWIAAYCSIFGGDPDEIWQLA